MENIGNVQNTTENDVIYEKINIKKSSTNKKDKHLNFTGGYYKTGKFLSRIFYGNFTSDIKPKDNPCVYVCRHYRYHGAPTVLKGIPFDVHTFVLNVFFDRKSCYKQYRDFTFSKRIGVNKFFAVLPSFIASLFVPRFFKSAKAIPVYRQGGGALITFRNSLNYLKNGENLLILPDIDYTAKAEEDTDIYTGFLYLEKLYYKETGKHLDFVPLKIDDKKKLVIELPAVTFKDGEKYENDFKRVAEELKKSISNKS